MTQICTNDRKYLHPTIGLGFAYQTAHQSYLDIDWIPSARGAQVLPVMETHQWYMEILTIYHLFGGDTITNTIVQCM